ncbi:MAG: hypothetical protein EOO92_24915 [Pedobacter sp.]|nr:MAG: hypothetical protein EOO92_24915 [Pedobacter sp.]
MLNLLSLLNNRMKVKLQFSNAPTDSNTFYDSRHLYLNMTAYIQTDKSGNFYNVNAYLANEGFTSLGWETIKYVTVEEIQNLDS